MSDQNYTLTDHDLLQRLDEKVDGLIYKIEQLQDGTVTKIATLERDKADRKDVDALQKKINHDVEIRVRDLEDWKTKRMEQIRDGDMLLKVLLGLGLLIVSLIIWHLTGGTGGFKI